MSTKINTCHAPLFDAGMRDHIGAGLLTWYRAHRRDLPWRRMQSDPYAIWVSEIMLQQTQVATVIPYFEKWMARFPTLDSLAAATSEDVLSAWAGLGYYARARNLHKAAQIAVDRHGGAVPADERSLSSLPGIGRYTLGAILSIGFNRPYPVLDANVTRVLSRVLKIEGDPRSPVVSKRLWQAAGDLIPEGEARDFNQAMMELGALVCRPVDPGCERCPLLPNCGAGNSSDPTFWPQIPPGKSIVRQTHASAVIHREERVIVVKRPEHGLWGGLWEFPRRICEDGEDPVACAERAAMEVLGIQVTSGSVIGTVSHSVTHHAIKLRGVLAQPNGGVPVNLDCSEHRWVTPSEASELPMSSPQAQLLMQVCSVCELGGFCPAQGELPL